MILGIAKHMNSMSATFARLMKLSEIALKKRIDNIKKRQ